MGEEEEEEEEEGDWLAALGWMNCGWKTYLLDTLDNVA